MKKLHRIVFLVFALISVGLMAWAIVVGTSAPDSDKIADIVGMTCQYDENGEEKKDELGNTLSVVSTAEGIESMGVATINQMRKSDATIYGTTLEKINNIEAKIAEIEEKLANKDDKALKDAQAKVAELEAVRRRTPEQNAALEAAKKSVEEINNLPKTLEELKAKITWDANATEAEKVIAMAEAEFKAVQIGGPSGGCLTEKHLDEPLDFDSVKKFNAIVGSGGMVVMGQDTCMVEVARFFMSFTQRESCGKCTPCREGTKRMLEILERIVNGQGKLEDLDTLEELATMVKTMALCGLGKSAPLPVISTLKTFRDEYIEHIVDKKCRAKTCTALRKYVIDANKCIGCSKCAKNCPVNAISGKIKQPFTIDSDVCIKCNACRENCAFGAIYVEA